MKSISFLLVIPIVVGLLPGCSHNENDQDLLRYKAVFDSLYPPADLVIPYHSEWTRAHYPDRIREFKNTPLQMRDVVFIGNSITEGAGDWGSRLKSPTAKNRGIAGDVTDGVLQRLGEVCYFKPTSVFILIGINDLFNPTLDATYVANNILQIVATINKHSPDTKVFVQTILPTANWPMVSKIKQTNDILKSSADPEKYTVLDLHALFADANDIIYGWYTTDGVHLTEQGYQAWCDHVTQFIN